jgi:hypothetical protein
MGQSIVECELLTGTCTDHACDVKILLANSEPSTHDPHRTQASRFDRPLRLARATEKITPSGAGSLRCAGSAAPSGQR